MLGINCTIKILETILSSLPISRCFRGNVGIITPITTKNTKTGLPNTDTHLVDWMDMKHQEVSIAHTTE